LEKRTVFPRALKKTGLDQPSSFFSYQKGAPEAGLEDILGRKGRYKIMHGLKTAALGTFPQRQAVSFEKGRRLQSMGRRKGKEVKESGKKKKHLIGKEERGVSLP